MHAHAGRRVTESIRVAFTLQHAPLMASSSSLWVPNTAQRPVHLQNAGAGQKQEYREYPRRVLTLRTRRQRSITLKVGSYVGQQELCAGKGKRGTTKRHGDGSGKE
jgi:hypothetical protein